MYVRLTLPHVGVFHRRSRPHCMHQRAMHVMVSWSADRDDDFNRERGRASPREIDYSKGQPKPDEMIIFSNFLRSTFCLESFFFVEQERSQRTWNLYYFVGG
jgi:hypothetical protein